MNDEELDAMIAGCPEVLDLLRDDAGTDPAPALRAVAKKAYEEGEKRMAGAYHGMAKQADKMLAVHKEARQALARELLEEWRVLYNLAPEDRTTEDDLFEEHLVKVAEGEA